MGYRAIKVTQDEETELGVESEYEDALNLLPNDAEQVDGFVTDTDHFIIETLLGYDVIEVQFFTIQNN